MSRIKAYLGKLHEIKKFDEWTKISKVKPVAVLKFPLDEQMKYHDGLIKYWNYVSGDVGGGSAFPVETEPDAFNSDEWEEIQ